MNESPIFVEKLISNLFLPINVYCNPIWNLYDILWFIFNIRPTKLTPLSTINIERITANINRSQYSGTSFGLDKHLPSYEY